MGGVVRLERRVASFAVVTKLVELGYLQPGARHRATAVERAIDRLVSDLHLAGVIQAGDVSVIEASRSPRDAVAANISQAATARQWNARVGTVAKAVDAVTERSSTGLRQQPS